jgi:hypothetical protein
MANPSSPRDEPVGLERRQQARLASAAATRKVRSAGAVGVAVVLLGAATFARADWRNRLAAAERLAEGQRAEVREAARLRAVAAEVPTVSKDVDAAIESTSAINSPGDLAGKVAELTALRKRLDRFNGLKPVPPEVVQGKKRLDGVIALLTDTLEATTAVAVAVSAAADADQRVAAGAWLEADALYANAVAGWGTHPERMNAVRIKGDDGKVKAPDPAAEKAKVERKRQRIAIQVRTATAAKELALKKEEQEKREAATLATVCGPQPACSSWDGECVGIASALKDVAGDPSAVTVSKCSAPVLTKDKCWVTTCDVRGKNAFGGMVRSRRRFSISALGVSDILR